MPAGDGLPAPAPADAPAPRARAVAPAVAVDRVHAVAQRPQVDHVRVQPREGVVVILDLARLGAVDAAGEGDLAIRGEHRRVVEAAAAGDETTAGLVAVAQRPAGAVQPGRDHLEAGPVRAGFGLDDAAAPAHVGAKVTTGRRVLRRDRVVLALQRLGLGGTGGQGEAGKGGGGEADVHGGPWSGDGTEKGRRHGPWRARSWTSPGR